MKVSYWIQPSLSISRIRRPIPGDHLLVAFAHREQHGLGVIEVPSLLAVVLDDARLHDRVHRAGFLAEAAEDALGEVDVVARGAARAIGSLLRLDVDRERRADGLAQLAGDAALLAVRIAAQRVQAPHAGARRRLFLRELDRNLAREGVAAGERQALEQLHEQERAQEIKDARHGHSFIPIGSTASASSSRSARSTPASAG